MDPGGAVRLLCACVAVLAEDMDKLREMEMLGEDGRGGMWPRKRLLCSTASSLTYEAGSMSVTQLQRTVLLRDPPGWTLVANVRGPENLCRALDGCDSAFHTSAFVDSGGISGYTVSSTVNVFL